MTIQWHGKTQNLRTVGDSKAYDHQTVQAAVDYVSDAGDYASDNPYGIYISRGIYTEQVSIQSITDLDIFGEYDSVVRLASGGGITGGTFIVGDAISSDLAVNRITIRGFRIVNNMSGAIGQGGPPEAALYLGKESGHYDTHSGWDNVLVENMILDGVHDGFQAFGPTDDFSGTTPRAIFKNCVINCIHDAVAMKGRMRLTSMFNTVRVNTTAVDPYLDNAATWKSTGFHLNLSSGMTGTAKAFGTDDYFESICDRVHVHAPSDGIGVGSGQPYLAGYLLYDAPSGANSPSIPKVAIIKPEITVINEKDDANLSYMGGIVVQESTNALQIPEDRFIVQGGRIYVDQRVDSSNVPDNVDGMLLDTPSSGGSFLKLAGTIIKVINAKSGGNANSFRAVTSADTIEAVAYSDESVGSGSGSVSALGSLP